MKKKTALILASILLLSGVAACEEKEEVMDDNISMVNFTDTGDLGSNVSSKKNELGSDSSFEDETVISRESENEVSEEDKNNKDEKNVNSDASDKQDNADSSNSASQNEKPNENVVIYYDEEPNDDQNVSEENGNHDSNLYTSSRRTEESDSEASVSGAEDTESDTDSESTDSQIIGIEPGEPVGVTEDDIAFSVNGSKINLGDSVDEVVELLGQPQSGNAEAESMSYITYDYSDFSIRFVREDDSEEFTVDDIQIYSEKFETEKGLRVNMTVDEARRIYGKCSTVTDFEYRFYVGNKYMYIYAPNEIVANIGYSIDYSVDDSNN